MLKTNLLVFYGKFFLYYFVTGLASIIMLPLGFCRPKNNDNMRLAATWVMKPFAKWLGVHFEVLNPEILAEDRGAIVVCNHQSSLDILGLYVTWGVPFRVTPVAKKELFYVWPFGLSCWLSGLLFIDRSNPSSAYKTLKEAQHLTKIKKAKIWIYPEGTRNKKIQTTRELLPFKRGAFKMAVECQVPIIPVVYSPYYFMDESAHHLGEGTIKIRTLEPISTEGLTDADVDDLIKKTRDAMQETYDDLYREIIESLPKTHPFVKRSTL